ncbi:hypothetical protein DICSQDRAFT_178565 [Dichomitus squalens LYAD-421 SS1]|uniref:uncharacterized protein n=1 Tax=Dichomitus squalens (strain LYAD-421) TaxID=732165 RepID=UPI0004414F62|nr:uncharacterized protein DICSQDRAFT_178565 [Dichomitus squalens LYAD-421 SS1]EJF64038.1 hypothetical protein DICSQDRAFT_178565 [Dichomitus squalens LYAD-421 SS1]
MSESLKETLDAIRSNKVADRQKGYNALRVAFDRDSAVLHFDRAGNGKPWLAVFQALFEAFTNECKACERNKAFADSTGRGSTYIRRLGDVASLVRWLTERSLTRLNSFVLKPLLLHLTGAIVDRSAGQLLAPVALPYAKAIKSIITYKPHLYSLKDKTWHELLALAFNVVVGAAPKRRLLEHLVSNDSDGMDVDSGEEVIVEGEGAQSSAGSVAGPSTPRTKRSREDSLPSRSAPRATAPRSSQPVSLEQIEFMSVIAILLRSSTVSILDEVAESDSDRETLLQRKEQDPHVFPRRLLNYFSRFLRIHTGDTSLHPDYLIALSAALSHLTLNCRQAVSRFANESWDALVNMWGTKNQRMKEDLVVVFRLLFPLLTAEPLEDEASTDPTGALASLWTALDSQVHSRWGVHNLSIESLQLHLMDEHGWESSKRAFVAETFRYGWHFDPEQALSWATLELQADCAEQLYLRSESTYVKVVSSRKRVKVENPVLSLLQSIRLQATQQVRTHHLQVILFFVDRHWHVLHGQLQHDIVSTLVAFVSFEDAVIQSWTFLCLAAIAHAECASAPQYAVGSLSSKAPAIWDSVWTHAMRRANVPAVSRSACHTAHVLLTYSKRLLSSHRVLIEIESFAKDLDVQGPAYPFDSVCDFMVLCLRIANQDVRLYRMQMEEKVLSWLTESWRIGSERRTSMPLHTTAHIHALLEGITGSSKRVRLQCEMMLPHCAIVDAVAEEAQTKVIRDFQLQARLPPYRRRHSRNTESLSLISSTEDDAADKTTSPFGDSTDLTPPRGRERRISAFLLKSLEELATTVGPNGTSNGFPTAERVRSSLDLAVTALCFEASLLMNGTQSNRRILQAACKLLGSVVPLLTDSKWKAEERRLILHALDPLTRADNDAEDAEWVTLVPPGERTGIRTQVLRKLLSTATTSESITAHQRDLQRFVFRSADVQDAFVGVLTILRNLVRISLGQDLAANSQSMAIVDDSDGFGPVRDAHAVTSLSTTRYAQQDQVHNRHIVDACVTALAVVPILQSSSGEPTRDRALTDLVLQAPVDQFLVLGPAYCEQVGRRTLNLSTSILEGLFTQLELACGPYAYSHSEETHLLIVKVLDKTSHVWMEPTIAASAVGQRARLCCWNLVDTLQLKRVRGTLRRCSNRRSWRVIDAIIRFLDGYLAKDPSQEIWVMPTDESGTPDESELPAAVLPALGNDDDIRIRFRIAATSPRLLTVGRLAKRDLMYEVYHEIHKNLSTQQENYESILTRLLCLSNVVISDASVRRGAYWHLLEVAFYSTVYLRHLKAVLNGIVERMGIETLSDLFNCYASQFAYSIRRARIDLFKFPSDLLGYRDRRECAEATFHSFTPTNLLDEGDAEEVEYGKELFVRHCQAVQKSEKAGLDECFPELVAYEIVYWLNHTPDLQVEAQLEDRLRTKTGYNKTNSSFKDRLQLEADGIVVAILRSFGDQDISLNGPILDALQTAVDQHALGAFKSITQYRGLDIVEAHKPNLPFYPTPVILHALEWLRTRVKEVDSPALTYHVLHELFADIEASPLVNEQLRLLNAVSLWVACHHAHFQEESLLRNLTLRAVTMLAQVDLARGAQSLLEWCFANYRTSSVKADYRLADVLIRTSTIAQDFSQTSGDAAVANLGADLLAWVEKQADTLRSRKSLKKQVVRALAAWPRDLPEALRAACEEVQFSDLTSVLVDYGVSSSKFRLVRRIHDLAAQHELDEHFSRSDFWRLKGCIPPERYLVESDIGAFTSLLMLHHGQVDSIGSEQFEPESVRVLHARAAATTVPARKDFPPRVDVHLARSSIVVSLRAMLDVSTAAQVHVAYQTLRALMSVPSSESYTGPSCSGDVRRELEYLQTFAKPFRKVDAPDLHHVLRSEEMLQLVVDFDSWIARLTTILCDVLGARDPFFSTLAPVLQSNRGFAEEVLPVVVHCLLQLEHQSHSSELLGSVRNVLSEYFSAVLSCGDAATPCHRAIISVVLHLRRFHPSAEVKDALAYNKWLVVDYTVLSRSAIKCSAFTTALLFLEMAAESNSSESIAESSVVEQILFEIYSHIDEPDGFYGIRTGDLRNFFVKRLHHENQWEKAFRYHGAMAESGSAGPSNTDGIVQSMYAFGFNQLALSTMQNFYADTNNTTESSTLAYNLGWRADSWDLPENLGDGNSGATLYLALRAVYRERSPQAVDVILRRAFTQEMNRLRDLGNENFTEIRQVVQNLMCLSQVKQWRGEGIQKALKSRCIDAADWKPFTHIDPAFDFANMEAIMATRMSLIRSARQKEQRLQIGDLKSPFCDALLELEKSCLLCLSERARDVHQSQIALNSVTRAQNLDRAGSPDVDQEFANVLWLIKEPKLAVQSLANLVSSRIADQAAKEAQAEIQRATLLARLGTWSSEASMKKPSQIVSECFGPAAELVMSTSTEVLPPSSDERATVFQQYAIFAERQYHAISKSPDALRWKLYVDRKREEIKQRGRQMAHLSQTSAEYQNLNREQGRAQTLLRGDLERSREHLSQRTSFLTSAVEMYSRCLAASDKFDEDSPIRLCSLWLANFDSDDPALRFGAALDLVPSRKFVFLAHQLTARLSKSDSDQTNHNQEILQGLIQRMGSEHPFHSLFPLYCLKGDHTPSRTSGITRRQSGRFGTPAPPSQVDRAAAVSDLFDRLRCDPRAGKRVRAVERVCDASLEWAKHPIKHLFGKGTRMPSSLPVPEQVLIRKLKDIQVPVVTAATPIDPTTEYRDCVWISHFDGQYSTAGGVNLPKILKCYGSNGKAYKQLYKGEGEDDLRQDAVMEQVFDLVNVVLRHDRETRRRKLGVRGYKVIPLAAQAGVLEFVDNTTPLANWLRPAHQRYRPTDLTLDEFSKEFMGSNGKYSKQWRVNPQEVIDRFARVRQRFQPVMRHYFTEKHKTPMSWFAMRLHYARSVATNSIVGHILGLGDRHTSNILIDNKTGEVVHIDLGIAFEQGKLLPQPERVPFRLTADMVDGLGISGTQGVFQRCAEETLRVLRDGSETILTVLEVFRYDPLHSWTASEFKIKRAQAAQPDETAQLTGEAFRFAVGLDMASGATDEAADRALSTVARKLDKTLSVEYTVNELITEASDPANLALMYIGWAPHM